MNSDCGLFSVLPTEVQAEMVQHIIQFNLTGRQSSRRCVSKG